MNHFKLNFSKFLLAFSLLLSGMIAWAETPDPSVMLISTADKIINALNANQSHLAKNKTVVLNIVNQYLIPQVDVNGMARSVLGRNAWTQATPSQQKAFTKEFVQLVVRTYANPLSEFSGETIKFFPLRGGYEGKSFINANSVIVRPNGNKVPLDYSLVLIKNQWKIYDMNVEGVSLLQSFRSQFASELSQGNMDQLIANLKQHNNKKS